MLRLESVLEFTQEASLGQKVERSPSIVMSEIISAKSRHVLSNYEDTFDYSIYDKLIEKFGEQQPRGGAVFKTTFRLVNHYESCSKCHYAFELDTYGRGCTHNCTYCYSLEMLTGYGYWNRPHPMPVDIGEIRKIFATVFETDRRNKWRSVMEKRVPLRLGSMSDCFMKMDRKYRVTHEVLKLLRHYRYPYIIFTRSDLVADDEYLDVMDRDLASVQFSISGGNESLTKKLEPGAPSVADRLTALRKLASAKFWTTVRINPLFLPYPDGYFTDKGSIAARFPEPGNIPTFPLFELSFIDKLAEAKVPSVVVGVARLSPMALNGMSRASGVDLKLFFRPEVCVGGKDRHYSDNEVAIYYKMIQEACSKRGIRFNTCYIGNGLKDYFAYQDLWDNKRDCCDARGNVSHFNSSSQEISWGERTAFAPCKQTALQSKNNEEQVENQLGRYWN